MCGRYNITSAPEQVRALFRYPEQPNFPPRYNVAPTQPIPIVRMTDGKRQFALVRWGLIPPWVKDPRTFTLLINARAELVNEKPAFKNAMKRRRCLIPADGFYEWKTEGGRKRPFVARPKGDSTLMAFAGLWENWIGPNGEELETAAIVTTDANAEMGAVHHRAPVIVPQDAVRLLARLRECEREGGGVAVSARAGRLDGGLRDFHRGEPGGQRCAATAGAIRLRRRAGTGSGKTEARTQAACRSRQRAGVIVLTPYRCRSA